MSLFDDPAVIEAATHTACEATGLSFDGDYDRGESIALDILTAALAALDREALIEKAAEATHDVDPWVYGQDGDGENITKPWSEAPPAVREEYRVGARAAFVAIGLIPDSPEGTR
jgi:hypothetical protein